MTRHKNASAPSERTWECKKMDADHTVVYERRTLLDKVAEVYHGDDDSRGIANAHLITASPQLLRAAELTLALWNKHGLGDDDQESEPVYRLLRSAVAEAKGQFGN